MTHPVKSPRKLIEVALPLDAINAACAREKSIRHGHPSTLHLWWARRPLAAARAVIFAQLVNDPGFQRGGGFRYGKNKKEAAQERQRLFKLIEDLVIWENTGDEQLLDRARAEIQRSWREICDLNKDHPRAADWFNPDKPPALHDPFAGGGAIPLEAQRLGLIASASDLNPVATLINKAMIEVPPKFAGRSPVGPDAKKKTKKLAIAIAWKGATGLAEDVRRYGEWVRSEAEKRIGHLFPPIEVTPDLIAQRPDLREESGRKLTVIGWIWARTIASPNPAFSHVAIPLASSFVLYDKPGKEAWIEPQVEGDSYRFAVKVGKPPNEAEVKGGTKLSRGAHFRCLMSGSPISSEHIYAEANAGRLGARLMAVVAEGRKGKVYLPPTEEMERIARSARPAWKPELPMPENPRWFSPPLYGLPAYGDLYTERQLTALNAFSDLTHEVRKVVLNDALVAGMTDDRIPLSQGGSGATAYADAIAMYLAFAGSRMADRHSTLCRWDPNPSGYAPKIANTFGRHALPMVWDYVEGNPFSPSSGNFSDAIGWVAKVLDTAVSPRSNGSATQADAQTQTESTGKIVSTDPPYYDNIGYADLSDYFYVWLRRSLKDVFPDLFATVAVPKAEELVATPYRHGGRSEAEAFFLAGMTQAMKRLAEQSHPAFPVTIYYAFKQSEGDGADGTTNTGWETFLEAVLRAGFAITGTWPMRTELINRMVGAGTNALASSIVLVCRKRANAAPSVSRREFLRELNVALPEALDEMIHGSGGNRSPVAPVDLSQAIIGPGMAVFSSFSAVLEADGSPMGVRTALQLINRFLTDDDFDADTQFCARWFEQHGWKAGKFGDADTLSRAKGTSVEGVRAAGVIESGGGQVRLLKWSEYDASWDPKTDTRNPVWETLHHLVRALKQGGESAAGRLLTAVRDKGEPARQLAYRLYTLCERQSWAEDARVYNEIITSWSGIEAAAGTASAESVQGKLFD
jgi:putative DNA methylase